MKLSIVSTKEGTSYLLPFLLVTSLFFLWGFAHSILDVLNKHFQEVLVISKAKSALVQAVVYGGYFLMALPAGLFIRKKGYRAGIILGLLLYGTGAFLFIPGSYWMSFPFFLFSLFVIGCGLTCLETAANPYVTVLGEADTAASRLNLAQSFNGLGWIFGPLIGGLLLFSGESEETDISLPYLVIGCVIVFIAFWFLKIPLPEIREENEIRTTNTKKLREYPHFVWGVVALFFYVAAQTGINSFFINYVTETAPEISNRTASVLLSFGGMGLFMTGRFAGSWTMRRIAAPILLVFCSLGASLTMLLVIFHWKWISICALFLCFLFESIMFPTIFALALKGVGQHTKKASSFLIMSIVGGAIAPVIMGLIGEKTMAAGFIVPLVCFTIVGGYGFKTIQKERLFVTFLHKK